jgi:hypothetical protein
MTDSTVNQKIHNAPAWLDDVIKSGLAPGWIPNWKDRKLPLRPRSPGMSNRFKTSALFPDDDEWREPCLIEGILPAKGVVGLVAARQTFKSFVALDLALHVAYGRDWFGRKVNQGSVVYVSAEDELGMRDRRLAWRHAHPGVGDLGYFLSIDDAPMLGSKQGDAADLIEFIREKQGMPRLVIIDTLSKVLHGENENQEGMIAVMANADKIANAFDCVVMLVHHAKRGEDRGRGADQFGANSQGELTLKRRGKDMATIMRVARLKGFSEGERILLRMSEPITLRRQEYGRAVTSLTIESAERAPERVEQDQCDVDPATGEVRPRRSARTESEPKRGLSSTERSRARRERIKGEKAVVSDG